MDNIKAIIETTLKAEIVKALNAAPDAIEKLITSAITAEVGDRSGSIRPDYHERKVPYLDYLIGDEIRRAARDAVHEVIAAQADAIKASIKSRFTVDDVVDGFAKYLIAQASHDWRVEVKFAGPNKD